MSSPRGFPRAGHGYTSPATGSAGLEEPAEEGVAGTAVVVAAAVSTVVTVTTVLRLPVLLEALRAEARLAGDRRQDRCQLTLVQDDVLAARALVDGDVALELLDHRRAAAAARLVVAVTLLFGLLIHVSITLQ